MSAVSQSLKGLANDYYRQSKLANIVYNAELARQYASSNIKFVSVHPGAVNTESITSIPWYVKLTTVIYLFFTGVTFMEVDKGRLNQLWTAAGAQNNELVNGGFYMPVGRLSDDSLDKTATNPQLAQQLWVYTQDVLSKF